MPHISCENARELSARGNAIRWSKPRPLTVLATPNSVPNGAGHTHAQGEDIRLVQEQIDQTRKVLNDKTPYCPACERCELEPHHRAQLLKALDSLLARKSALLGIHLPGPSKAPRESTRRAQVVVLPQESLDPGPVQPVKPVEAEPTKYWDYEGC